MDENTIETTAEVCDVDVTNDELYTDATVIEEESCEDSSLGGKAALIGLGVAAAAGIAGFIYNRMTGKISQAKTDCISKAADGMIMLADKRESKQAYLDEERAARVVRREERKLRKLQQKRIGKTGDENTAAAEENK